MGTAGPAACADHLFARRPVGPSPRVLRTTTLSHERMWEREHTAVWCGGKDGAGGGRSVRRLKPRLETHEVRLRGLRFWLASVSPMQLKPRTAPVGVVSGLPAF
ncbi:hypothetical protein FHS01_005435 [Longimicrobium terrae]|uniref:Uncharacterized protein n=1 Tax=Longimicrobium terrae TaxID=1639882 RepID=A0A841H6M7_9BACT|nr:hypothetical protein [Longimicrobium terrae]MBB6073562.1 hypothetical protein [Longimicrobium terrae]